MKKFVLLTIIGILIATSAYSQDKQELAKSDSLYALGVELYNAGEYYEAIPFFDRSSRIDRTELDSKSNRRDYSAMWLASCYYKIDNEYLAKNTDEKYYMLDPIDRRLTVVSDSLFAIGMEYYMNNNYEKALEYLLQCAELEKNTLGNDTYWCGGTLYGIAECFYFLGDYAEAVRLGTEALEIRGRGLGKEHPDYAITLSKLAGYNFYLGDYAEAVRLGTEALEIRGRVLGKEHPDYAITLSNLAMYNSQLGDYAEAVRLETETLEIKERVLGKEHPDYVIALNNLAVYNSYLGNYAEVNSYLLESTHLQSQFILNTFSELTSRGRVLFWDRYKDWFEGSLPLYAYYLQTDSLIATTYDGALFSKGLLLNTEIEMNKLLQESGDTVIAKYQSLLTNKAMINKLQERFASQYNTNDTLMLRNNIDSLRNVVRLQERELVQLSKTYGDYTKNLSINWHDVQEKLGKNDVAIEFLSFPVRNDSIMYVALTLTKDDDVPHMTSLFEKKELSKLNPKDYYDTPKLAELVWVPLSDVLKGKKNVYFSPAGELYNIAIENIPYYDGEGLMSDPEHRNMYRLSSTRNLALIKDKYDIKKADVYGGLKYDMTKAAIEESGENSSTGEVQYEVRAIADSLSLRGGIEIPPRALPATKIEAEDVKKILVTMDVDSKLYTDTLGTETSFKALSGNKTNLLHIATHGFYWTDTEAKNMGDLSFLTPLNYDASPRYVEDKALTRTGLIFAGASYALEGNPLPEGVNDGILTAKEISILDLRGLDIVVLSACQTGLGEITGDGVFGLQRGFKKAGANTIMMSLWEVNDEATQLLVSEFYNNLAQGKSKYDALREAQQFVRDYEIEETITTNDNLTARQRKRLELEHKSTEVQTTTRKVKPYASPVFWAAFILLDAID